MHLDSRWSGWSNSCWSWFTFGSTKTRCAWLPRWSRSARLAWETLLPDWSCDIIRVQCQNIPTGKKLRQVDSNIPGNPISPMPPLAPGPPGLPGPPGKPGSPLAPGPKQKHHVRTLGSFLCITSECVFVGCLNPYLVVQEVQGVHLIRTDLGHQGDQRFLSDLEHQVHLQNKITNLSHLDALCEF